MGILNGESHACADSHRFFVTTNLKTGVLKLLTRICACTNFTIQNPHQNSHMRMLVVIFTENFSIAVFFQDLAKCKRHKLWTEHAQCIISATENAQLTVYAFALSKILHCSIKYIRHVEQLI